MPRIIRVILASLLTLAATASLLLLLGKALLGDQLVIRGLRTQSSVNPSLILLISVLVLIYLFPGIWRKARLNLLAILGFVLLFFTLFQYDRYPLSIEGDGVGYFAYLHSLYFDKDLNFFDEYRVLHAEKYGVHGYINDRGMLMLEPVPQTGYQPNAFSIGPSLLWYPFYGIADRLQRHSHTRRTGYEPLYLNVIRFGHILLGLLGTIFLYRVLICLFPPSVSFLSLVLVILLSPFYYYQENMVFYSHICSYFTMALFIFVFFRVRDRANFLLWGLLGLVTGLVALMRWQNTVIVALPIIYTAYGVLKNQWIERRILVRETVKTTVFLLFFLIGCLPQLIVFKEIYGRFLIIPQGSSFISFFPSYLWQTLLSPFHGLFYWHPLLAVGLIGMFIRPRSDIRVNGQRPFFTLAAIGFSLQTLVNGSIQQFWAGAAFGARRFVDTLGFLAFGFANIIDRIRKSTLISWIFLGICLLFSLFNIMLELAFTWNLIPAMSPVRFSALLEKAWVSLRSLAASEPRTLVFHLVLLSFICLLYRFLLRRERNETAG